MTIPCSTGGERTSIIPQRGTTHQCLDLEAVEAENRQSQETAHQKEEWSPPHLTSDEERYFPSKDIVDALGHNVKPLKTLEGRISAMESGQQALLLCNIRPPSHKGHHE